MHRVLVVAYKTILSAELLEALRQKHEAQPDATFDLLLPAAAGAAGAEGGESPEAIAELAAKGFAQAGLKVSSVSIGSSSAVKAIQEALRHQDDFKEIVICTFPLGLSRWLGRDVIHRARLETKLPVQHVIAHSLKAGREGVDLSVVRCDHQNVERGWDAEEEWYVYRCTSCGSELPLDALGSRHAAWRP
jgi:hypothetical protein